MKKYPTLKEMIRDAHRSDVEQKKLFNKASKGRKIMKKQSQFDKILEMFVTNVSIPYHDKGFFKAPKKTNKKWLEDIGFELQPQLYHPIIINWSEKGRGFGEYVFWQEGGKIFCDNECDGKEAIKRVLCRMVDQAELRDNVKHKRKECNNKKSS